MLDTLKELERMQDQMSPKDMFKYLVWTGAGSMEVSDYKSALRQLLKAKKLGEMDDSLDLLDFSLYYNISICLTNLDFSYRAEEYIRKALIIKPSGLNKTIDIFLQTMYGISLMKTGRQEEAIDVLEECVKDERRILEVLSGKKEGAPNERIRWSNNMAMIYYNLGLAYHFAENYDMAIMNVDKAIKAYGRGSPHYATCLHGKVSVLFALGQRANAVRYLSKGLEESADNEMLNVLFNTIKPTQGLEIEAHIPYLEETAIPKLLTHGKHLRAIDCCYVLRDYYEANGKLDKSLKYSKLSHELYRVLMEGDYNYEYIP